MYGESLFIQALIYLAAAVISVPIAKRLGLGSVLGYLLAGMILGPYGLHLIGEEGHDVMHFAEFGVVMMLFLIGLELEPQRLWNLRRNILGLGGLQVVVTTLVISIGLLTVGLSWQYALTIALSLSLSSTALVLQTIKEKGINNTDAGQRIFTVLLFQDIAVIPMLAFLPLLATLAISDAVQSASSNWLGGLPAYGKTLAVIVIMSALIIVGRYLTRPMFRFIARAQLREIFTAAALLLVISIALLMNKIGLSPALGTFVAGVVLANSEYRHELESNIEPFKGLLLGVFFIAVGASMDFSIMMASPGKIVLLVTALIIIKMLVLFTLGKVFKLGMDQNLIFTVALAQGGEFAFVLVSFALQSGVLPDALANQVVAVVVLSMASTPLLMLLNERFILPNFGTRELEQDDMDEIHEQNDIIIAGFNNFGSSIGRLLRANKINTTVLEYDSDHVETLRSLGFKVFYGDASRIDLLRAAGAEQARYLIITIRDAEKVNEIVDTAHQSFPQLKILARARGRSHAYELMSRGVFRVYRDTLDTSLRVGVDMLRLMGFRGHQAHRASGLFRRHDESMLEELSKLHQDRTAYLTRAREGIFNLEEILELDQREPETERDEGWDTSTLREEVSKRLKDKRD